MGRGVGNASPRTQLQCWVCWMMFYCRFLWTTRLYTASVIFSRWHRLSFTMVSKQQLDTIDACGRKVSVHGSLTMPCLLRHVRLHTLIW